MTPTAWCCYDLQEWITYNSEEWAEEYGADWPTDRCPLCARHVSNRGCGWRLLINPDEPDTIDRALAALADAYPDGDPAEHRFVVALLLDAWSGEEPA